MSRMAELDAERRQEEEWQQNDYEFMQDFCATILARYEAVMITAIQLGLAKPEHKFYVSETDMASFRSAIGLGPKPERFPEPPKDYSPSENPF